MYIQTGIQPEPVCLEVLLLHFVSTERWFDKTNKDATECAKQTQF